jgi:aryl-alcohol dehydrogenase-like predicted oxidoreductase
VDRATPAAVALAWAISHEPVIVIPGASTIAQLEANAAATDVPLSRDELHALEDAAAAVMGAQP